MSGGGRVRYNVRLPTAVFCLWRGQPRLDGRRVVLGQPLLCKGSREDWLWLDRNGCSIRRRAERPLFGLRCQRLRARDPTSREKSRLAGFQYRRESCEWQSLDGYRLTAGDTPYRGNAASLDGVLGRRKCHDADRILLAAGLDLSRRCRWRYEGLVVVPGPRLRFRL
ncbi:uncharacterized protein MEPE_04593 [Melanopsichium pennsylvanicum]|uniref:Uncharacterized protein n=1 Tax=Melanopsichium pennsylvanicum TaxID=63383 RepID=A0AAJ4XN08_9BASI|nr:uncharacterized protein MEPE_04593 [Melanopsichium pennsylvanicum]